MNIKNPEIAYFSAEIGVSSELPTYSGGLGVLAGDHIKSAADIGLSMVAVTLLYREGYFRQTINQSGKQIEKFPSFNPSERLEELPNKIKITLRGRDVWIRAYKLTQRGCSGGAVSIYFLDTYLDKNIDEDKSISLRLYSGDNNHRILQEAVLGFGGFSLLESLGFENIKTYHMNEGHCAFLTLALLKKYNFNKDKVRSKCHFTTHTPVEAGHDHFSIDRCRNILGELIPQNLELPTLKLKKRLHMTELGLYLSRSANGVSKLHGEVAQKQFPDFKIDFITNGVYHPHWAGNSFCDLFDKRIKDWKVSPNLLLDLKNISDEELAFAHQQQKDDLVNYINSNTHFKLSSNLLTIGFARRAAEYKRARLIFSDLNRLKKFGKNKIQFVFAGKAHPNDKNGKKIIQDIVEFSTKLSASVPVVFLENYDMELGRLITSGVDVWLNTPLRPNEASGTSGMKAALNAVPNLSIIDGWWAEGCIHGKNGWAIGSVDSINDQDDADSLYTILESDVIPTFYKDQARWLEIMRSSIKGGVNFTGSRMIKEYNSKFYSFKKTTH